MRSSFRVGGQEPDLWFDLIQIFTNRQRVPHLDAVVQERGHEHRWRQQQHFCPHLRVIRRFDVLGEIEPRELGEQSPAQCPCAIIFSAHCQHRFGRRLDGFWLQSGSRSLRNRFRHGFCLGLDCSFDSGCNLRLGNGLAGALAIGTSEDRNPLRQATCHSAKSVPKARRKRTIGPQLAIQNHWCPVKLVSKFSRARRSAR